MAKSLEEIEAEFWSRDQQYEDLANDEEEEAAAEGLKTVAEKEEDCPMTANQETKRLSVGCEKDKETDKNAEQVEADAKTEQEEADTRTEQEEADTSAELENTGTKRTVRKQKIASVISDIIFYLALITMIMAAIFIVGKNNGKHGGYYLYEVLTASMESVYPRGSLVLVKQQDPNDLVIGDDITYYKDLDTTITHRIVEIIENYEETGARGFITKGVENVTVDSAVVNAGNVVGRVVKGIPYLGALMTWMANNLILLLGLLLSLIVASFFIKYLFGLNRTRS